MRLGWIGMALACAACSPPRASDNAVENAVEDNADTANVEIARDPAREWGTPEYKARREHDLAICRAIGVEAGRLRLDFQDDDYLGRLPYLIAHQPTWVEKPVAEYRALFAEFMYQESQKQSGHDPKAFSRAGMLRILDNRIRDGELRAQQARVHFRDAGDMTVTRMALANWRHSPTRLKPKPDIEWSYRIILSRGAPAWSEDAARFWEYPYWFVVVEGDAYLVRNWTDATVREPEMSTYPDTPKLESVEVCAFAEPKTYDACEHRPANAPCLNSTAVAPVTAR